MPAIGCAIVCGCGLPAPEKRSADDIALPTTWTMGSAETDGRVVQGWLREFSDPVLEKLVDEALEYNYDLRAAASRLRIAEDGVVLGRSGRLPTLGFGSSASYSESRFENGNGRLLPFDHSKSANSGLNASWELDIWGRLANLHQATRADYQGQLADFRGARLSLVASIARAWCNLVTARQQLRLAEETRASFRKNLEIVERLYKSGDDSSRSLDVSFGRNQVASAERSLISRRLARDEARRTLEILLGRYPASEIEARDELPTLGPPPNTGLPSELLMRRPDLVAAAADLRASTKRAQAARKALLPSISLTANGSTSVPSLALENLIEDPSSIVWNIAASIAQPIYRGGALRAQARQSREASHIAAVSFATTALNAFREVESALSREHSLAAQEESLQIELEQAELSESQANRDYPQGLVQILSVLEAQRRAFNARFAMIALRNERLLNRISLHLALGGDFETLPSAEPTLVGRAQPLPVGTVAPTS